jgi:hypothetical protein
MDLHLPQSFLGVDETLGEEEVGPFLGLDGRDAPAIAPYGDRSTEAGQIDPAVHLRQAATTQLT